MSGSPTSAMNPAWNYHAFRDSPSRSKLTKSLLVTELLASPATSSPQGQLNSLPPTESPKARKKAKPSYKKKDGEYARIDAAYSRIRKEWTNKERRLGFKQFHLFANNRFTAAGIRYAFVRHNSVRQYELGRESRKKKMEGKGEEKNLDERGEEKRGQASLSPGLNRLSESASENLSDFPDSDSDSESVVLEFTSVLKVPMTAPASLGPEKKPKKLIKPKKFKRRQTAGGSRGRKIQRTEEAPEAAEDSADMSPGAFENMMRGHLG